MNAPEADDRSARPASPYAVFDSVLPIPEIRDYQRINAEVAARLDAGQSRICLSGAEGQRLLLEGLQGPWSALLELEGRAGPELAAGLDAPGLTIVAHGPAADGAARGLRAGRVILLEAAGDALGYVQEGGTVLAAAGAGHRVGLGQRGGVLVVLGPLGRLAGERQSGGRLFVGRDDLGPHAGHGRRGGAMIRLTPSGAAPADPKCPVDSQDAALFRQVLDAAGPWIEIARRRLAP
jgi:glutamate synthase domain-containing protein 3